MRTVQLITTICLSVGAMVGGCGKASNSANPAPILPIVGPYLRDGTAVTADQMKGYWVTPCARPSSGLFGLDYVRHQVYVDGNTFVSTTAAYKNDTCVEAEMEKLLFISGTFALGTPTETATPIDFTLEDVSLLPLVDNAAFFMNGFSGTCGLKDWKPLETRSVKDIAGCDYLYTASMVPFSLVAKVGDQLSFGNYYSNDAIGRTAQTRPDSLAVGEEMTKSDVAVLGEVDVDGDEDGDGDGSSDGDVDGGSDGAVEPITLDLADATGSWNSSDRTLVRGTAAPLVALQASFRYVQNSAGNIYSLDYSICKNSVSCSGGDIYAHISGKIVDQKLVLNCRSNGFYQDVVIGEVQGAILKVQAPVGSTCPNGLNWVQIEKTDAGTYRMTAVADNYGEVISGSATLVR